MKDQAKEEKEDQEFSYVQSQYAKICGVDDFGSPVASEDVGSPVASELSPQEQRVLFGSSVKKKKAKPSATKPSATKPLAVAQPTASSPKAGGINPALRLLFDPFKDLVNQINALDNLVFVSDTKVAYIREHASGLEASLKRLNPKGFSLQDALFVYDNIMAINCHLKKKLFQDGRSGLPIGWIKSLNEAMGGTGPKGSKSKLDWLVTLKSTRDTYS